MATKTIFIDDISGDHNGVETIDFSLEGTSYTIDLGPENAEALRDALAVFVDHAQRVGGPARKSRTKRSAPEPAAEPSQVPEDLNAIRDWARENGYTVSSRGRIAQSIKDAYAEAK